ncbi:MAG: hypothetical protein IPM85_12100 [Chitinophagaceae bacterium]|nr:hypothetical protein [Chitinophagaceae bacterium]
MIIILHLLFACFISDKTPKEQLWQGTEREIVYDLFRLRNEHKADSAEGYLADTVQVYMKNLRNVPRRIVTMSDKTFWKAHPGNRFEITVPVQLTTKAGITTAIVVGKEYLDGTTFQYERIEIRFNRSKKIYYYRGTG